MPNRNGTGPMGQGAKTGRGKGNCSEEVNNQNMKTRSGGNRGNMFMDENTKLPTKELLLEQKAFLENALKDVEKQLLEIDQK